jgi:small GTP-binding protein
VSALLRVAVVGHTNTGKTSLMRTLLRDVAFGEVSDHPAVTREVESAVIEAGGAPALELFDTPGLEDSIGLLEALDARRGARRIDGVDVVRELVEGDEGRGRFAQEAKALRQVLASDVALYVTDARDRVLAKHRDELEILGRCAVPVVPVLNFTAAKEANVAAWREHLARANMHAVAEFDTVVYDEAGERRLYEKMASLLDRHRATLTALAEERSAERRRLLRASMVVVAEMLVDVAALCRIVPAARAGDAALTDELRQRVRVREQAAVDRLLALHRFRPGDVAAAALPLEDGAWGHDLFSPEAMKRFGVRTGSAAATGAMVGLTADVMLGGMSLGAAAAAGALIGGLVGAASTHGRRLVERLRGSTELRVGEPTLQVLILRQLQLVQALLHRGHAAMTVVRLEGKPGAAAPLSTAARPALKLLARARAHPAWSSIGDGRSAAGTDPRRAELVDGIAAALARSGMR